MKWWIVLSTNWQLVDVQAGLVVVISLLSFIAVFTSARYFWHTSARRISKNADVPISSLLSFTTIGEVIDVVILLKSKLLHSKHFALTVQCILVIGFSACAIFAGPISRYATRVGSIDGLKPNKGLLATRSYGCELDSAAKWRNITDSLDNANFPHDQLLDFLPDTSSDWVYHAKDWNSTWSAKCSITTEANITLEAKGIYRGVMPAGLYNNIPALNDIFSSKFLNNPKDTVRHNWYLGTTYSDRQIWESMLHFAYAEYRPDHDGTRNNWTTETEHLSIHLSAVGIHGAPMYPMGVNDTYDYGVGKGKIPNAWYTKVECDLSRPRGSNYNFWEANVDTTDCLPATNMNSYFYPNSTINHGDNTTTIVLPTGEQLFRFFQAYSIGKDTHFPHQVTRSINHRLPTVEISTFFIGIMSIVTLVVIIGLIYCLIARFYYNDLYKRVPETKVDWLLQSLREAENNGLAKYPQQHPTAPSTTSYDDYSAYKANPQESTPWEKARYSIAPYSPAATTDPYSQSRPSTANGLGSISLHRHSPAPPSLTPGPPSTTPPLPAPAPVPFNTFLNARNGYTQLPNPAPYPSASPAPSYVSDTMMMSPSSSHGAEHVVSYGVASARAQQVVSVGPKSEKGEWEVGVVETRR